ncbi:DMT family transporter [bacterium]|nr:DMT family transporter [bacterium]
MKTFLFMLLAAIAACVIPLQAVVNGRLGQILQNPFLAALVSFTGGTIALVVILLITTPGIPTWPDSASPPWYLLTGGFFGVVFVTAILVLVPHIGTANLLAASVAGQLITAIIIDHYGLLGLPQQAISLSRVAGCLLLIGGLLLIQWK